MENAVLNHSAFSLCAKKFLLKQHFPTWHPIDSVFIQRLVKKGIFVKPFCTHRLYCVYIVYCLRLLSTQFKTVNVPNSIEICGFFQLLNRITLFSVQHKISDKNLCFKHKIKICKKNKLI